ncbi:hypothetical protein [Paracoccus laeviglucosivorans]|uniref:hypothetical protein n=1 Tax=Paracoccus laeviglucosivorans TaxID=1197861 RepID=UPI00115BD78C|nr:hypothetical protein [Paracoccus laeviglucosivorans]
MHTQTPIVTPREIADARAVLTNPQLAVQLPETALRSLWHTLSRARKPRPAFRPKAPRGAA